MTFPLKQSAIVLATALMAASASVASAGAVGDYSRYSAGAQSATEIDTQSGSENAATRQSLDNATRVDVPRDERQFSRGTDVVTDALEVETRGSAQKYGYR